MRENESTTTSKLWCTTEKWRPQQIHFLARILLQQTNHLHAAFATNPEHVKQASTWRAWMSVANSKEINPSSDSRRLNRHIRNQLWRGREGCKYFCWKNAKDLKPRNRLHFIWNTSREPENSEQKLSKWILHRLILLLRKQELWFKMTKLRSKCNNPFRNLRVYWHVLYVTRYGTKSRAYNVSTCKCVDLQELKKCSRRYSALQFASVAAGV